MCRFVLTSTFYRRPVCNFIVRVLLLEIVRLLLQSPCLPIDESLLPMFGTATTRSYWPSTCCYHSVLFRYIGHRPKHCISSTPGGMTATGWESLEVQAHGPVTLWCFTHQHFQGVRLLIAHCSLLRQQPCVYVNVLVIAS